MNAIQQKIESLPPEARQYLVSMKAASLNQIITEKYGFFDPEKSGILAELIGQLFFKELKIRDLPLKLSEKMGISKDAAKNMANDIVGMRMLVVDKWLGGEAFRYLTENGVNVNSYNGYIEDHAKAIAEEEKFFKQQTEDDEEPFEAVIMPKEKEPLPARKTNIVQERNDTLDLFTNSLVEFLQVKDEYFLHDYNKILILLLAGEDGYKKQLEETFYRNEQPITAKPFKANGNDAEPTVKNWIKYFIEVNGSDEFDDIKLSRFIETSENTKLLDEEEKRIVLKLLKMYRCIKFFPKVFGNLPLDKWEIVSVDKEDAAVPAQKNAPARTNSRNSLISELKGDIENYAPGSLEREILEEESEKDQEYHKLLLLSKRYPEGSLERRAIEDEIRKMGK